MTMNADDHETTCLNYLQVKRTEDLQNCLCRRFCCWLYLSLAIFSPICMSWTFTSAAMSRALTRWLCRSLLFSWAARLERWAFSKPAVPFDWRWESWTLFSPNFESFSLSHHSQSHHFSWACFRWQHVLINVLIYFASVLHVFVLVCSSRWETTL